MRSLVGDGKGVVGGLSLEEAPVKERSIRIGSKGGREEEYESGQAF